MIKVIKEKIEDNSIIKGTIGTEVFDMEFSTTKESLSSYLDALKEEDVETVIIYNTLEYNKNLEHEGEVISIDKKILLDIYKALLSDNPLLSNSTGLLYNTFVDVTNEPYLLGVDVAKGPDYGAKVVYDAHKGELVSTIINPTVSE